MHDLAEKQQKKIEMAENSVICGCKGIRTCLICEKHHQTNVIKNFGTDLRLSRLEQQEWYCYCWRCSRAWGPVEQLAVPPRTFSGDCEHSGNNLEFPGVTLVPEFVSEEEETELVRFMDESPWKLSQSGRIKQDYGPKVNFKRQKLKQAGFSGLPYFMKHFVERMNLHSDLSDFEPVEQCNLDYQPDRGSAIDPHVDDGWLWGKRLVTLNLLSGTYLDMTPVTTENVHSAPAVGVRIPLPARSLLVLSGPARYQWNHGIQRGAIVARRIAITLRELAREFLVGGAQEAVGNKVLSIARTYNGTVVS